MTRPSPYAAARERMTKNLILRMLEKHKGNVTHTANDLGISRMYIYRLLERYGIKLERGE